MSFALIDAKKADVAVETACAVLNVSVSGFYAWKNRPASKRQTDDMVLLAHIRAEFATSNETYGSPRMHAELKESGLAMGVHRVARLMSENGLKARSRRSAARRSRPSRRSARPRWARCQECARPGLHGRRAGSEMGCRHLVCLDRGGLALPGHRPRPLLSENRGLVDERSNEEGLGDGSLAARHHFAATAAWPDPSFGPWQPVLRRRLQTNPEGPRLRRVDERAWKLLRQCHGRDGLQDHQIRVGLADFIRVAHRGRQRDRTIHRRLL